MQEHPQEHPQIDQSIFASYGTHTSNYFASLGIFMTQETEVTKSFKMTCFFFPGKPALIALVAVAALAFVGLIVAIIACSLHKKKRGAQSISNGK